jgi:hypothetical protein
MRDKGLAKKNFKNFKKKILKNKDLAKKSKKITPKKF